MNKNKNKQVEHGVKCEEYLEVNNLTNTRQHDNHVNPVAVRGYP